MTTVGFLSAPGPFELLVILFVVLLLFGAKRLPDLARSLGKSLGEFKRGRDEAERTALRPPEEKDGDEENGDRR
jgi:sec-independent protein translocase protein TatA